MTSGSVAIDRATQRKIVSLVKNKRPDLIILTDDVYGTFVEGFRSLAMASVERKSGFVLLTNGDGGAKVLYDTRLGEVLNRLLPG